jgi:hypothetical protein
MVPDLPESLEMHKLVIRLRRAELENSGLKLSRGDVQKVVKLVKLVADRPQGLTP